MAMLSLMTEASKLKSFTYGGNEPKGSINDSIQKKWAVLIAGSNSYGNYRHQVIIYHTLSPLFF